MYLPCQAELERARLLLGEKEDRSKRSGGQSDIRPLSRLVLLPAAVLTLGLSVITGSYLWVFILTAVVLLKLALWRRRRLGTLQNFEADYTALLLSLASSIRTGLDPLHALCNSAALFQPGSSMRQELEQLASAVENGASEEEAIFRFGSAIGHPDVPLFRTAFLLSRRQGGSLAECLQRLSKVTRQRQSFRRKMKGAVAMQKLSSLGIGGCAVVIALMQGLSDPEALRAAINHPFGFKAITAGILLIVGGMTWMMRMTRTRI